MAEGASGAGSKCPQSRHFGKFPARGRRRASYPKPSFPGTPFLSDEKAMCPIYRLIVPLSAFGVPTMPRRILARAGLSLLWSLRAASQACGCRPTSDATSTTTADQGWQNDAPASNVVPSPSRISHCARLSYFPMPGNRGHRSVNESRHVL
jgi:hypothetical protein